MRRPCPAPFWACAGDQTDSSRHVATWGGGDSAAVRVHVGLNGAPWWVIAMTFTVLLLGGCSPTLCPHQHVKQAGTGRFRGWGIFYQCFLLIRATFNLIVSCAAESSYHCIEQGRAEITLFFKARDLDPLQGYFVPCLYLLSDDVTELNTGWGR